MGNALIIGLWIVTRTTGIPFGPGVGEVEAIGVMDSVSTLCELALIGCSLVALSRARQTPRS